MSPLVNSDRFSGVEVRRVPVVGFSILTMCDGKIVDRIRIFPLAGMANEWAERLHRDVDAGTLPDGTKPQLKLTEGGDAKA